MIDGLKPLIDAAIASKRRVTVIGAKGTFRIQAPFSPGRAELILVDDSVDDEQIGLSDKRLPKILLGCDTVMASAGISNSVGQLLATKFMSQPDKNFVIVMTGPERHAVWSNKAAELSGSYPSTHVIPEGLELADLGLVVDPSRGKPH